MLPSHGRITCDRCFDSGAIWGRSQVSDGAWRITNNPLAWGNPRAEIIVLGFSKGPTQAGALEQQPHDEIAFRKGRANLAKILHHVGLLEAPIAKLVDRAIADTRGRFHFGSLIRCTVERYDERQGMWMGTGGGMLDGFAGSNFGRSVVSQCSTSYLRSLPSETKLVLMLGMGAKQAYVQACRRAFEEARPGVWRTVNDVAYRDDQLVVVHTEHFAAQGALIPNWLSGAAHPRGALGLQARDAVEAATKCQQLSG